MKESQIDMTLLTLAHATFHRLADHFMAARVPTDVMLHLAAIIVAAETNERPIDDVLADVRGMVLELLAPKPNTEHGDPGVQS